MRKSVIVGNWKMNMNPSEAQAFASELKKTLTSIPEGRVAGVSPTLLACSGVNEILKDTPIIVGAQVGYWEASGAFTGQVSMKMLKDADLDFCIIGHSEQRQFFGETNETVQKRTAVALEQGLLPIVCIGETLEEREGGKMEEVLATQIAEGLKGISLSSADDLIVAYEPIWAIGTGKTATPEMAEEAHVFCRAQLEKVLGTELAAGICIQYGGSAKPENAASLLSKENIDGLLVGGASLKVDSFSSMITC